MWRMLIAECGASGAHVGSRAEPALASLVRPRIPAGFESDELAPFSFRVYAPGWGGLDPNAVPWTLLRKRPADHPPYRLAKRSSLRTVVGFNHNGTSIFLKRSLQTNSFKRLLDRFRGSKEWRELELALAFQRGGFSVPDPLFYAEGSDREHGRVRYYATRALAPDLVSHYDLMVAAPGFGERWLALARFTARLHNAGFFHGDYRGLHLFIRPDRPEEVTMIDLDGSRVGEDVSAAQRATAIMQLTKSMVKFSVSEADVDRFLHAYDPARKFPLSARAILAAAQATPDE